MLRKMGKYLDANQLSADIKNLIKAKKEKLRQFSSEDFVSSPASSINNRLVGNEEVLSLIDSSQKDYVKLSGWIARDGDGTLMFGKKHPRRVSTANVWVGFGQCMKIEKELFPEITWAEEAAEVELLINKL